MCCRERAAVLRTRPSPLAFDSLASSVFIQEPIHSLLHPVSTFKPVLISLCDVTVVIFLACTFVIKLAIS